jgi:FMN phosphatase YigB (HAD superfamily)
MNQKTFLFDLDGTLLGIDDRAFEQTYFNALTTAFKDLFDPKKLVSIIWKATQMTVKDLSEDTNEVVFMRAMKELTPHDPEQIYQRFLQFYQNEFIQLKAVSRSHPEMISALEILHSRGHQLAIATNPLFPKIAVDARIAWAGLNPTWFSYVSSFERNTACKPQLKFYQEVLTALNADVESTWMIGNDPLEDMIVKQMGVRTYLVTDDLVQRPDIEPMWDVAGRSEDFLTFVQSQAYTSF